MNYEDGTYSGSRRASSCSTAASEELEKLIDLPAGNMRSTKTIIRSYTPSCLVFTLLFLLCTMFVQTTILVNLISRRCEPKVQTQAPWLPPARSHDEIFRFQSIYGEDPSPKVEDAWTSWIPQGKGFVKVQNESSLPDRYSLGFQQSLPDQLAMVSVFHQLHCLYMTRMAYFSVLAGNIDEVHVEHLRHCWDYLRQAIMCAGDTTLEWVHPPDKTGFTGSTGWGNQHTCRDYGAIYDWAEQNRVHDIKKIHR